MLVVALLSLLALTAAHSNSDGGAGRERRAGGDLQPSSAIVSVQYTDREGNLKAAFRYHVTGSGTSVLWTVLSKNISC